MRTKYLLSCLLFIVLAYTSQAQLVINEFMASNASTIDDPDFGKKADWIEIYNGYPNIIDIGDYYISDDEGDLEKWQIPTGTSIESGDYLLIWADKEDTGLHTNFQLSKDGERIHLSDPQGILIDSVLYSVQSTDVSYGRVVDGSEPYVFMSAPSPGSSNGGPAYNGLVFHKPLFSTNGGLYNTSFELQLFSSFGTVRYTLDGSVPSEASPTYDSPISIDSTMVVRARIFSSGLLPGKTITHSYFLDEDLDVRALPVVSISTEPGNFWSLDSGLYTQNFLPEWEYPINIELFENDGNNRAVFNETAGVQIKGNNSWLFPQKIMGIYFKNDYGNKTVDYPIFAERDRNSFDHFVLRASGNDQGSTFFRDGLFQDLISDNMDFPLQGFRAAAVYVNGEYLGLHNIRSKQNEAYFKHYYDLGSGDYDLILNNGEVDEGDDVAFNELFDLLEQDLSIEANYNAVEAVMDMDNLIDYFVSELWLSNRSWGHNIKMWKAKVPGSKWRFVLKDIDRGFYGFDNNDIDYFTLPNISPTDYEYARVILRQLFLNQNFVDLFTARFADHLHTTFHPKRLQKFIDKFSSNIEAEIPYHLQVWGGASTSYGDALPSQEYWYNELVDLNGFAVERATFMYSDLTTHFGLSPKSTLGTICLPPNSGHINLNNLKIPGEQWAAPYFQNKPINLTATSDVGYEFEGWSAATYETLISTGSIWKYLADGTEPNPDWRGTNFNDSSWDSGPAQLGYGDGDEQTVVSFGPDPNNTYRTTYFRKSFTINSLDDYTGQLIINLMKDDGAVVYLNGTEVARVIMPAGDIEYNTFAYHTVGEGQESDFIQLVIDNAALQTGENVLAVEIHQRTEDSSDMSFDLGLKAAKFIGGPIINTANEINFSLSGDTIWVANFQATGVCLLPEVIDQNTTLDISCSPYYATGDVNVLPGITLTVEAGVEIVMPQDANLSIEGNMQVAGSSDQPVLIYNNSEADNWGNLRFVQTTAASNLNHLIITGAYKGIHPVRDNAAVATYFSKVNMNNVTIDDVVGNLVFSSHSDLVLNNCNFHSELSDNMLDLEYGKAIVLNCDIEGSTASNTTAIHFEGMDSTLVQLNKIYNLLGANSNAMEFHHSAPNVLLLDNFIHNITDKGISVSDGSLIEIKNNTLVNCNEGIAIKHGGVVTVNSNTFYNTQKAVRCFEKEPGDGGGSALITNSILSNSSDQAVEVDDISYASVSYSLSDTEELTGANNLFSNPLFVNPTLHDFQLQANSPCIDAGLYLGFSTDMGTKSHVYSAKPSIHISAIQYHPEIDIDAEFIEISNPGSSEVDLSNYKITEGIELTIPDGTMIAPDEKILLVKNQIFFLNSGQQVIEWESDLLDNGGETIRLKDAHGIVVDEVRYDDDLPWPLETDGLGAYLSLIGPELDNHFAESWEAVYLTALKEEALSTEPSFTLHPNPASNQINLLIESQVETELSIQISNVQGSQMMHSSYSITTGSNQLNFDVSSYPNGTYFIKMSDTNGTINYQLFTITK